MHMGMGKRAQEGGHDSKAKRETRSRATHLSAAVLPYPLQQYMGSDAVVPGTIKMIGVMYDVTMVDDLEETVTY